MSRGTGRSDHYAAAGRESGVEALRRSPAFRGRADPLADHDHSTDHLALIYQDRDEQFGAAVPFLRQGLERNERCIYVADENTEAEVVAAMEARGIDVEAARESGALTLLAPGETYHRTGEFDPDAMVSFWEESLERATTDEGFSGIRAAAEMTWAVDGDADFDQLVEYEAVLNRLYQDEDYVVLCQYNRQRFPPAVIRDVVRTHPHLIQDRRVTHNVYYTEPEEFLGPDEPAREVDRMLGTIRERAEAKRNFGAVLDNGHDSIFLVEPESGELVDVNRAACEMLGYSREALLSLGPSALHASEREQFDRFIDRAVQEGSARTDELSCRTEAGHAIPAEYSAATITADDGPLVLVAVRGYGERQQRERALWRLYEIAADSDRPLDEKFQAVFELGRDLFDVELGGLATVDVDADRFEVELTSGSHDYLRPGERYPLSETYCQAAADERGTAAITDPIGDGYGDKLCFEQFGVRAYLGTYLNVEGDDDRTLFFVSGEPREEPFSRAERTFHHLMGQWMKYELERRQRQRELRQRNDHLDALIETTPECIKHVAADGTLLMMNPAGLEMVEADTASEVVGESVYELIAPEHRQQFREFNESVCDGERGTLEFDLIGLEGTRRQMETHAAPLRRPDGTTTHVAVTRDVTEREEREAELRQTKNRFETVFERSDDAIFILDPDTDDLVDANPAAAELTGYAREELLTRRPSDLHPDEMERFRAFLDEVRETGTAWSEDLHCRTKDGRDVPAEISASAITLDGRELVLALARDISERKGHERYQRSLYEITADPDLGTEEKIDRLLEVGCNYLDQPVGMLNRRYGDGLEIQQVHGTSPAIDAGERAPPQVEHYCRQVIEEGDLVTVADGEPEAAEADPDDRAIAIASYAGVDVTFGGRTDGTFCFVDTSPRRAAFTDAEQSFLRLLGQCVAYELGRARRETRLQSLHAIGRELLGAESAEAVAEGVVSGTEAVLDRPIAAVALYDGATGELRPAAHTDAARDLVAAMSTRAGTDGILWEAFIAGGPTSVRDPLDRADTDATPDPPIPEIVIHPLGTHGVLVVGTTAPEGFRCGQAGAIETCAANVCAALDRADRKRQLREREAALEEQNETLERLNRINDTIRTIDQGLVEASSREAIERVVCEELAARGPYQMAWIGDHDPATGEVASREQAGAEKGYLDAITITADDSPTGRGPAGRALETGEPQVVNNVLEDESFKPWRQEALNRGYHATAALPLQYEETRYGVLNLYAGQPNVFDDLEREVLTELAATVAHAINAIESKKALLSNEVAELEFALGDGTLALQAVARDLDCEFELNRLASRTTGELRAFVAVTGAAAADVCAYESRLPVSDLAIVADPAGSPGVIEATLTDESLARTVLDHGGRVPEMHVGDGTASVVVHVAADAEVREFVEMFQSRYPGSELLAQRATELPQRTALEHVAALTEDLTERQEETLSTAYFNGYFEEPRSSNASEIAERMGVAQPTFNSHLRTALRKLCGHIYENDLPST